MTLVPKPNAYVTVETEATNQLTFGLNINPAPFTVSIPGEDPVLGSLEFVISNGTTATLAVDSVAFTLQVGTGASITPTTAGIATAVSDPTNWIIVGPPSPVTSGPATYTLQPATGSSVSLAPGASVVVQIFQIQTNTTPGNSTIAVKEMVGNAPSFVNFLVSTFPTGFYFDGLAATVKSGSGLVPCAQVMTGDSVTLVWNSSVVDMGSFAIYYSDAAQGQRKAIPTMVGEWISPALTSDTVFTVAVTVSMPGGQPLTVSLSTVVSVQNPTLIAAVVNTAKLTVVGPSTFNGLISANAIDATSLTLSGAASVASLNSTGAITTQQAMNSATLKVTGNAGTGPLTVTGNGTVTGTLNVSGNAAVVGGITSTNAQIKFGQNFAVNVSDSFPYSNQRTGWYSLGWFNDSWFQWGPTCWLSGYGGIKMFTGGAIPAFTIDYHANCRYYGSMGKASSIAYKENISALTTHEASDILNNLDPVQYNLKANPDQRKSLGFIAEHVPSSVATADGKAIIPDEIVAVLTRVVKDQQEMIERLEQKVNALAAKNSANLEQ